MPHLCLDCDRVNAVSSWELGLSDTVKGSEDTPACQYCGSSNVRWKPVGVRSGMPVPPMSFDNIYGVWRDVAGEIKDPANGNPNLEFMVCNKCNGPAVMAYANSYYESYHCEYCGNKFQVS